MNQILEIRGNGQPGVRAGDEPLVIDVVEVVPESGFRCSAGKGGRGDCNPSIMIGSFDSLCPRLEGIALRQELNAQLAESGDVAITDVGADTTTYLGELATKLRQVEAARQACALERDDWLRH